MTRVKFMWLGGLLLIAFFALVSLQGDARDGLGEIQEAPAQNTPEFVPVQCDPNTDPECNLPPPQDNNEGQPPGETETGPATESTENERSDRDGDGIFDPADACPDTFGRKPNGCPIGEDNPTVGFAEESGTASALIESTSIETESFDPERCLVITEVLWAGTNFSTKHQYIELHNRCQQTISLNGLQLILIGIGAQSTSSVQTTIDLRGNVEGRGYYLVVNNNLTVTNVTPDLVANFELFSENTAIVLSDEDGTEASTANLSSSGPWFAGGTSRTGTFSMERDEANLDAPDVSTSWHSNDGANRFGLDALGEPINGTPKHPNSPAP